jgi:hypothetical protein
MRMGSGRPDFFLLRGLVFMTIVLPVRKINFAHINNDARRIYEGCCF